MELLVSLDKMKVVVHNLLVIEVSIMNCRHHNSWRLGVL